MKVHLKNSTKKAFGDKYQKEVLFYIVNNKFIELSYLENINRFQRIHNK